MAASLILFFAQGFGSGRSLWAPGTFGTLPGVALYWLIAELPLTHYLALVAILFLFGIPLCSAAARILGRSDPPSVVWDEIVGYLVTMSAMTPTPFSMAMGFALFRLFDIWKPWPIRFIDRYVQNGLGIMLDDLVAGIFGAVLLHLFIYFDVSA